MSIQLHLHVHRADNMATVAHDGNDDDVIGAVRLDDATIQTTDPAALERLAKALTDTADRMRELAWLTQQRRDLLDDDRHYYENRYLDHDITADWPGFVDDEHARLDAEIEELSKPVPVPVPERDDRTVVAA